MPAPRHFYLYEIREKEGIFYPYSLLEESADLMVIFAAKRNWQSCADADPDMQFLITAERLKIW